MKTLEQQIEEILETESYSGGTYKGVNHGNSIAKLAALVREKQGEAIEFVDRFGAVAFLSYDKKILLWSCDDFGMNLTTAELVKRMEDESK